MKFSIFAAAFLPVFAGALQGDYLSSITQGAQAATAFVPGGTAFFPQASSPPPAPSTEGVTGPAYRPGGKIFYADPARTPSNPLANSQGIVTDAPDCTKPPQLSMLNKGTYERLNSAPAQGGYIFPDPANTPSNPLADRQGIVTTAPDCTKPPQVSMLNKGTYERLNSAPAQGGYIFPDPANTPSNPLAGSQGIVTTAPDCTKPPQVSMLNKGTYERLNSAPAQGGYIFPDPANTPSNPLADRQGIVTTAPDCTKPPQVSMLNKGTYERLNSAPAQGGYVFPDPANTPSNPLADRQGIVTNAPDGTKPPTISTINQGTYERLNGYGNPVTVNRSNPFSQGF